LASYRYGSSGGRRFNKMPSGGSAVKVSPNKPTSTAKTRDTTLRCTSDTRSAPDIHSTQIGSVQEGGRAGGVRYSANRTAVEAQKEEDMEMDVLLQEKQNLQYLIEGLSEEKEVLETMLREKVEQSEMIRDKLPGLMAACEQTEEDAEEAWRQMDEMEEEHTWMKADRVQAQEDLAGARAHLNEMKIDATRTRKAETEMEGISHSTAHAEKGSLIDRVQSKERQASKLRKEVIKVQQETADIVSQRDDLSGRLLGLANIRVSTHTISTHTIQE